jgi:hypothetical protein
VLKQVWESIIKYHTLDIKWKYNKNGFWKEDLTWDTK